MYVLIFVVSDSATDVVLPTAVEFARDMVIARVSFTCLTMGDPPCIAWLWNMQRDERLGIIRSTTCIRVVVFFRV